MRNEVPRKEDLEIIQQLLIKDFEFTNVAIVNPEELRIKLREYIQHLLNKDFGRLLQGLYRIDVDEEKVKEILHSASPENIADSLTFLILQRQQEKAITRRRYQ